VEPLHLKGKLALVTGAGRGMGRAIALALAGAGADLALLARTPADLEATGGAVRALGRRALTIAAQVVLFAAIAFFVWRSLSAGLST
jgi:7-alpha-hydroxysteroid dehydrogenase